MTYTELVAAISAYTENTFPTAQMNTFIQQAEQRIYNSVQLPSTRKNSTLTLTIGSPYLNCPSDFLSAFSLAIVEATGNYAYLLNKDVNFIREAYPSPAYTSTPKYYAIFGPQASGLTPNSLRFLLGPTPSAALSAELAYFSYPESIITAGSTWLGDEFDSALFNAAMVEAIRYMKGEPDMVKLYQDTYAQALTLLKNLSDGKLRQDTYRSGQVRTEVI